MNKNIKIFTLIAVIALGLTACVGAPGTVKSADELRTIAVNGTGTISLTPDMAIVKIGVETQDEDAQTAVANNNDIAEQIMAAMTELGIPDGDLKTTNFSVYPLTRYNDEGEITSISYRVNNSVQVTVRQLDLLGDVFSEAVEAGANNIGGIQFDITNREEAYAQAMEQAMANARSRAEVLAGAENVEIKQVHTISSFVGGGGIIARNAISEMAVMDSGGSVPVSSGEMEITVEVNVVFEIR